MLEAWRVKLLGVAQTLGTKWVQNPIPGDSKQPFWDALDTCPSSLGMLIPKVADVADLYPIHFRKQAATDGTYGYK